ncbi:MAG: PQQ-binding-like beta-propeller repeat protein [Deltaproteobacteria bacterium]|nr:PQQ-binding-like beta-propeller repeat protein [Deltaproteobacteria bacterium]
MDFQVGKDGKGGRFPLKTVMTEKSIYVLDGKGKISKKISLEDYSQVAMSDDGMTMATLKGREITISNLDEEVQSVVKIADPQPVVLPQHVFFELSPDGEYVVVMSFFTHTIYFHNRKGKLLSEHHFEDLRGAEVKFSKDSRYVAIHVPNWGEGKTNGYLLFFDEKGKKQWRFDHKGCEAKFDISSDGDAIVLAAENKLHSLNKKGKIIYEKELVPGGISIALSGDGKYVAVTRKADHRLSLLDNGNGKALWSHNISGFDSINSPFTSVDVSDDGVRVAVAISKDWTRRNKESSLYLFDKSGNILWRETFEQYRILGALWQNRNCMLIAGNKEAFFIDMRNKSRTLPKIRGKR